MKTNTLFKIEPKKRKRPKRLQVPFEKLRLMPHDEAVDHTHVNRLAGNIHIFSLLTPLIVQKERDHYVIRAGRRRYQALSVLRAGGLRFHDGQKRITLEPQRSAFAKIDCMVYPELPQGTAARDALTLIENRLRKFNPLAELNALVGLRKKGIDEQQTFRLTGTPIPIQRKLLKLANLSDQMRDALNAGKLSMSNAQKVAILPKAKQKEVWKAFQKRVKETESKRPKIIAADVQSVKRVQVQTALSGLSPDIFAPAPGTEEKQLSQELLIAAREAGEALNQAERGTPLWEAGRTLRKAIKNFEKGERLCPYCKTEVKDAGKREGRFVNGIRPKDAEAKGCEFCNPTPLDKIREDKA